MSRRAFIPWVLAIVTALCFFPTLSGSFLNWDDNVNFLDDSDYRGFGSKQIRWAFTSVAFGHYIPLTRLTWSMNYALGGMDSWGYHAVNVALHALNAVLFYFVARRLLAAAVRGGDQHASGVLDLSVAAGVAALVFGAHPLRVESVAWVSARPDLLSGTFSLLAALVYLRSVDGVVAARPGAMLACAAAFAAALLSKGSVLPLPVALLLLDAYPLLRLSRLGARPLLKEKIPLFVVMIAGAVVIVRAVQDGAVLTPFSERGVLARTSLSAYTFVTSLTRFIWPAWLSPLYEMPLEIDPLAARFALSLGAASIITVVLVRLRGRWPAGLAVWTYSALLLSPVSLAVRMGADLAPDRYTYLSGLGFAALMGAGALTATRLAREGEIRRITALAASVAGLVAIAGLGVTSWNFSQVWRSSETLWRWAVELDPTCSVCHGKLAESALGAPGGASRAAEAEISLRRAIALRPDLPDAYFNLGAVLILQGRYTEAEAPFRNYLERIPISLLRNMLAREPDAPGLRHHLVQALDARARDLEAQGRSREAAVLVSEARALESRRSAPP